MTRRRWATGGLLAGMALSGAGWLLQPAGELRRIDARSQEAVVFDEVVARLRSHYLDALTERELYHQAAQGIVDHLGDPYTALLAGAEYTRFQESLTGSLVGVGLRVERRRGEWRLLDPVPGSPAATAGLKAGDRLVALDDSALGGWTQARVSEVLHGPAGTSLRVSVRQAVSSRQSTVELVRAEILSPSIGPALLLSKGIGYVALTSLSGHSAAELAEAIDRLSGRGMTKMILDLRQNPGGLVSEGAQVAGLFLEPGSLIARLEGREGDARRYLSDARKPWPVLPLIVLVDGGTASSAELIAAALQDHDRASILGVPSYGKGVVQSTFRLADSTALRLTTGRWFAPSGRSIQRQVSGRRGFADGPMPAARPGTFRSARGRPLAEGVGIIPDRQVRPADLSEGERAFREAVGRDPVEYCAALAYVADRADGARPPSEGLIAVSPRMRAMLFQRLQGTKAAVAQATYERAQPAIDQDLTVAVARRWLGERAAIRVRLDSDPQISTAVTLLGGSPALVARR